ncbi:MAG: HK97 family phage prohead protease [Flavobacteriaceae bacterium]|nr:HK97 family phage prohead protease [Flavobacteriaceae bacterium]
MGIWDNIENIMEKRYYKISVEKRENTDSENAAPVIVGHAAVFNTLSDNLGGFQERISPQAFDDVLNNDVRAFFNHDPNHLLARSKSGTLRLSVDEKGLRYEFDVPDTTSGRDLLVSMERGDVTQSSFAFTVEKDSWNVENGTDIRTIEKVKRLYDVSPVSIPAYPDADDLAVAQRSLAGHKETELKKDEEIDLIRRNLLDLNIKIKKSKVK